MSLCTNIAMIHPVNDSITRARSKGTHDQRLCSAIYPCAFSPENGVVFQETEGDTDDNGDADGDEKSVVRIFHGEVWDHGQEAACAKV